MSAGQFIIGTVVLIMAIIVYLIIGACFASFKWHLGHSIVKPSVGFREKARRVTAKILCPFSVDWSPGEENGTWRCFDPAGNTSPERVRKDDYVFGRTMAWWPVYILSAIIFNVSWYGLIVPLYRFIIGPVLKTIYWLIYDFAPRIGEWLAS